MSSTRRRGINPGFAAALDRATDGRRQHRDWLNLVDVQGPFLTLPVLLRTWPQLDAVEKPTRPRLRRQHAQWQGAASSAEARDEWIAYLLGELLEWADALHLRATPDGESEAAADDLLDAYAIPVAAHETVLQPDFVLLDPSGGDQVALLGTVLPPGTSPTGRVSGSTWAATHADRMAHLCRHHRIELGLVTDGRWWCLVWAPKDGVTTTAVFDTIGWNESAEREVVRAWISLLRRSRFFAVEDNQKLPALLRESLDNQEEVTEALGVQVRQAVELLVDAIGRADVNAITAGAPGLHADGVKAGDVYRGAVAVMMRVVFLLFAEERGLLPSDNEVYASSYSAGRLLADLEKRVQQGNESELAETTEAWHRLIALFHAVYGGVNHPKLTLPAYDGSIFNPRTYWWLEGMPAPDSGPEALSTHRRLLPIDDLTVLHMLRAVQKVEIGTGKNKETRNLTFRALDVEQIGYVYEGLLSYDARRAEDTYVGLVGPAGKEQEVRLVELERLAAPFGVGSKVLPGAKADLKGLAKKISETYKEPKPGIGTAGKIEKLLAPLDEKGQTDALLKLLAALPDREIADRLLPFYRLLRTDLRQLPVVIRAGALYVTESSLRANTGTHYTPRSLAEQVVEGALEPLVYSPGPLQTAVEGDWKLRSSKEILQLKVADIAMGSAAFLVAACRYLAERLVEAWVEEKVEKAVEFKAAADGAGAAAVDVDSDPVMIEARRQIIEHCLYGVDINPMAVEMAKLSLWLVSMDPRRPFTFLDDRLVAGDSLLGIANLEQLETVHIDPVAGRKLHKDTLFEWTERARRRVAGVAGERRAITGISGRDLVALEEKRRLLDLSKEHISRLELIGDLAAGAALVSAGPPKAAHFLEAARLAGEAAGEELRDADPAVQAARERALEWLATDLPDDGFVREPVHWPLAFPEVFEQGGFDAVVGNPPFLGGSKITGSMGDAYREFLVHATAKGMRGNADLVAYFVLRIHQLLSGRGQTGLIATNTLAQTDTRVVGLSQIIASGIEIRRAVKSEKWPSSSAALEYCLVWTSVPKVGVDSLRILDGSPVHRGITDGLNPQSRVADLANTLAENVGVSFNGSKVDGVGFTLTETQARMWIEGDPSYSEVLLPYLNGQDVNTSPTQESDRWIISFQDWSEEQAKRYSNAYGQILRDVKPVREKNNREARRTRWWQFSERAPGLYAAISGLEQVVAIALTSKVVMPVILPTGQIFSHMLGVFASDDFALLALLSSAPHYWWAIDRASTMKGDLRYTLTDVFETLPRPSLTPRLRAVGTRLDVHRRELLLRRNIGLTTTYNLVHDESVTDADNPDIAELRAIHREVDVATVEAYGWLDLLDDTGATLPANPTHATTPLAHGFHPTDQGPRYTISLLARTEILDRLRELNHERYAAEVAAGLHTKGKGSTRTPRPKKQAAADAPGFEDDGLFPKPDALF